MSNTDTMSNTENSLEHQWHYLPTREVAQHLNSNLEIGLTSMSRATEPLWSNQLTGKKGKSAWMRFLQQFNQPLLYILLAAGVVTAFLQEWVESGVIFGVTLINAIIGSTGIKSRERDRCLAESVTTEATVIRNGQK